MDKGRDNSTVDWVVKDDFGDVYEPSCAELDAIEAFLLPMVEAIMKDERPGVAKADSDKQESKRKCERLEVED
jgi:hypothetical protein